MNMKLEHEMENPASANFELKGQFIQLLKETPFFGKDEKDTGKHVDDFIEIVDYFYTLE